MCGGCYGGGYGGGGPSRGCCSQFMLNHETPSLFARSQWFRSPIGFCLYRILLSLYLMVWLAIALTRAIEAVGSRCFIHLSEWTFIVLNCYLLVAALGTVYHTWKYYPHEQGACRLSTDDPPLIPRPLTSESVNSSANNPVATNTTASRFTTLPIYFKISWALFNVCVSVCPMVTIIFWGLLYEPSAEQGLNLAITSHVHAIGTGALYLDLCISAVPVRIAHLIYPIIYGVIYVLFTIVYWEFGGVTSGGSPAIYPILDWQDIPLKTVGYISVAGLIIVGSFTLTYAIYRLRIRIFNSCCKEPSREQCRVNIDYDNMTHDQSHDPTPAETV